MFKPPSAEYRPYCPPMLDQAMEADSVANQVYWRERTPDEEILDALYLQKIYRQKAYSDSSKKLQGFKWLSKKPQIEWYVLKAQKEICKTQIQMTKAYQDTRIVIEKIKQQGRVEAFMAKHQLRIAWINFKYSPTICLMQHHGPEIAWLAGIGSATRMALATEEHLINGDPAKAAITAGIGVASLAAPYVASKYFGKKEA